MNKEKYTELIAQQLSGNISEKNRKLLLDWARADEKHQALLDEATQLWALSENYEEPFETDVKAAWEKVEQRLAVTKDSKESSAKVIGLSNFKRLLQIAAVFLMVAIGSFLLYPKKQTPQLLTYQTADEETLELLLPDSSRIVLNENSRLSFQQTKEKRQVSLTGEAWFDVQHMADLPFEIQSGATKTVVLGTAFNVRAYPDEEKIEVSVARGKVAFSEKENLANTTLLPAGTEGVFYKNKKTVVREKRENENADAWRTKTLIFDDTKLYKVFETLERYFEVKIEADAALKNCAFKGKYEQPQLENILKAIEFGTDARMTKAGNTYKISGAGCPK